MKSNEEIKDGNFTCRNVVSNIEHPIKILIARPVTLCSLTKINNFEYCQTKSCKEHFKEHFIIHNLIGK